MSDRVFGVACLFLALGYLFVASGVQLPFLSDPVGPRAFPYIIGVVLALASIYPLIRPDDEPVWPALPVAIEIAFAVAVMVAYAFFLKDSGFVVTTAIAAAILSWRLGSPLLYAAIAGISISVAIYVVFHLILGLSLARGPWGFKRWKPLDRSPTASPSRLLGRTCSWRCLDASSGR